MIRFHPLTLPTLITIPGLILACALGVWQLQRLEWKEGLIADVDARIHAPAIHLAEALGLGLETAEWRKVRVEGRFLHANETYLFAVGKGGEPGLHVLTPLELAEPEGGIVLVDRGFIPEALRDPATRVSAQYPGIVMLEGVLRAPQMPNAFTPAPDIQRRVWYARDPEAMAAASSLSLLAPVVIDADATPNPGGWPLGGQTVIAFPNSHLSYAITWFGLALALLAVYLVYHWRQGRLRFG
ncbi:MAG: hypothetical protein RJB62_1146 [Pseudomonadota bacterium]|jgi:surfeit locus 1 family protein